MNVFATFVLTKLDTARIRRVGKVIFSQVCPFTRGGGLPQSQVLSQVSGPRSFLGGTPSPRFFPRSLLPVPFPAGVPLPPRQNSRSSTCYAAGGMPLVVTQEDFLVFYLFCKFFYWLTQFTKQREIISVWMNYFLPPLC